MSSSPVGLSQTTVAWSEGYNGATAHAEGGSFTLPDGVVQPLTGVIVAEVNYVYSSPVSYYIVGDLTLSDIFYLRPRKSLTVEKID